MNNYEYNIEIPARFQKEHTISKEKISLAIDNALKKLEANMSKFGDKFPQLIPNEPDSNTYYPGDNSNWTCGMYTGCYILAYELSGEKKFLDFAKTHMASYQKRLDEKIEIHDHDVGFVYSPSCVAYYKQTGDESIRKLALDAAEHLYKVSYSIEGGFILRVGTCREQEWACRTMMDTLMNIPLFYWAYKETGDSKFLNAANSQIDTTANYLIRPDGSSYHHYQFDTKTHAPLYGLTFQGNRNESTWSRGHAWGVLGFPWAYIYTHNDRLLDIHKKISYYMINHLPKDNIPYWDYDFMSGNEPRDSSAGVISICGFLEAIKYLPCDSKERNVFKNVSSIMLEAIIDNCEADNNYDGLINKVTAARKMNMGINGCAPYGDYFYLEALAGFQNPDRVSCW